MATAVGIDLGTTNSVIAAMEGGKPTVITNGEGLRTTPSVVAFTEPGRAAGRTACPPAGHPEPEKYHLFGQAVHRAALRRGDQRARTRSRSTSWRGRTKRFASRSGVNSTRRRRSPRRCCASWPMTPRSTWARRSPRRSLRSPRISTTRNARRPRTPAKSPDLNVLRIINEPTAAALAYGLDKKQNETHSGIRPRRRHVRRVASWTSVTVCLRYAPRPATPTWAATISTSAWWITSRKSSSATTGSTCAKTRQALQRLYGGGGKSQDRTLTGTQTTVSLPFITADANGPKHLDMKLMRATFEELTADLVERCVGPVKQAMADAKMTEARHRRGDPGRRAPPACPRCRPGAAADRRQGAQPCRSTRTRWSRLARRSRRRASRARSRTSSCSTSRRCRWASRRSAE